MDTFFPTLRAQKRGEKGLLFGDVAVRRGPEKKAFLVTFFAARKVGKKVYIVVAGLGPRVPRAPGRPGPRSRVTRTGVTQSGRAPGPGPEAPGDRPQAENGPGGHRVTGTEAFMGGGRREMAGS